MSKALFTVVVLVNSVNQSKNVLAQDAGGKSALAAAIDAAVTQLGGTFQNAVEIDGPIDYTITPAVSPATDGTPKSVFRIQFQAGSGPNNSTPAPVRVVSWPQTSGGVTTSATDLAIATALANAPQGSVANGAFFVGSVDIDATA